jgi:hypothetical protein
MVGACGCLVLCCSITRSDLGDYKFQVVGLPVLLFVTGVVSTSDVLEQQPQQQDVVSSVGAQ